MDVLTPHFDHSHFVTQLNSASSRVLISDYDGTLSPFCEQRDEAVPYAGVAERLEIISDQKNSRLVIVSGRSVKEVLTLLGLNNIEIWGCHGAERFHPLHGFTTTNLSESSKVVLDEVDKWTKSNQLAEFYERKPFGVAFHWRGLPERNAANLRETVKRLWHQQMDHAQLKLYEFDGGLEVRSSQISKKHAVERILKDAESDSVVAYLGDDNTDEDAFAALDNRGLKVLVRSELRPTRADIRLDPPVELLAFLDLWIEKSDIKS